MRTSHVIIIALSIVTAGLAFAQAFAPAAINGCVVLTAAPTYTNLQQVQFTCDASGKLRTGGTP